MDRTVLRLLSSTTTLQRALVALAGAALVAACATGNPQQPTPTKSSGGGGDGGNGGATTSSTTSDTAWPCGQDCSLIDTAPCTEAVCNEGQVLGPVGLCVVVNSDAGTPCDDGLFCSVGDACDGDGQCLGNATNDCGLTPPDCAEIVCDEGTQSCTNGPANNGAACTPTDLCSINGVCQAGNCLGVPKDCTFSPLTECNLVACNPANGKCEGTADPSKNGASCVLTGDLCSLGRSCVDGACAGGTPKDCSAFSVGCTNGTCDSTSGACLAEVVPEGGTCYDGIDQCHVGVCDASSMCVAVPAADGTNCNDGDTCTESDSCVAGVCAGFATVGCTNYLLASFESCPSGFTLAGDWQCGAPSNVGPGGAHGGTHLLATQLAANYSASLTYDGCTADATLDLTGATAPKLSFWVWLDTEGSSYDGFNVKVSTNGGATFTQVSTVTPAYNLTVAAQPAWGGHQSASGWRNYLADLTSFAGNSVVLRFAFRSDGSGQYPGVYIDDVLVAEPSAVPLSITTSSLADGVADDAYAATLTRVGGSTQAAWSILGGINSGWLTVDPATGQLTGTPTAANAGPVTVTVEVQELAVPGNFATKTFSFDVLEAIYFQSFEGPCPNGWTLGGAWQCGVPTSGPLGAFGGSQVLATVLAGNYTANLAWATCTADSPDIDLTNATTPKVTFRMWVDTEGSSYDGANLKISTDGGASYTLVSNPVPAYNLASVGGEPAWGGHQAASGWQQFSANLSSYAGQVVRLRLAFRTDGSGQYPGVYVDEFFVGE